MDTIVPSRSSAAPHPRPEWFSGPVFVDTLNGCEEPPELEVLAVYFDAGSRTRPHTHTTDQLLVFLEGEGIVADRSVRRRYRSGGMAVVPAGEWHWHGATADTGTCHLSIRPAGPSAWPPEVEMGDWDTYMEGADEA
jgi:quercetin dioxygenase-like cupin family protein